MLIAKFAYNNIKNINTSYTPFEHNCDYHSFIFYKKKLISGPS